jgi:hypothetical protein
VARSVAWPTLSLDGAAAVSRELNVFETLSLWLAFLLAGFFGAYFYKYLGRWGMLPAIVLGLVLATLSCASIVRSFRQARRAERQKNDPTRTS